MHLVPPQLEQALQRVLRVLVVFHDEHAARAGARFLDLAETCRSVGGRAHVFRQQGQRDLELAAAPASFAARVHLAAVQLDERAHEREADAKAAARSRQRHIGLREQIEDGRQRVRIHADAAIANR